MNYLDIFFIIILVLGAVKGYLKGFIVEAFSFLAFFVGLFLAIELTIPLANRFFASSDYFQLYTVVVFLGLFFLSLLLINLAAKAVKKAVDLTIFGIFDNVFGALAAAFKWAFIISVIFWVFDSIGLRLPSEQTSDSFFYPFIVEVGPVTFQWLSDILPFVEDMMDSLKNIGEKDKAVYTFL